MPKTSSRINFIPRTIRKDKNEKIITEDFIIEVAPRDKRMTYEICVEGEDLNITLKNWKNQMTGSAFPLELIKVELLEVQYKMDRNYLLRSSLNAINNRWKNNGIVLEKIYEDGIWSGWGITVDDTNIEKINCRLTYKYLNNRYLCSIIRQKENVNE